MTEHTPPAPVAWRWRKSSYSQPNGECVEVAPALDAVRDSKDPASPVLTVPGLPALLTHLKGGRFDR